MAVQQVTDAQFEDEVINSPIPVLIDFYADWCGPCKAIAPIVEDISRKFAGRLKVVKVDTDRNPAAAQAFQIRSIPTLAILHERQILDMQVGAVDRATLTAKVEAALAAAGVGAGATAEVWDAQRVALGIESGLVLPLDVRGETDYTRAHLPEALNIPRDEVQQRIAELQGEKVRWAVYGRTDEGMSELGQQLADAGLSVCIVEGGLLAWESELLPIERG